MPLDVKTKAKMREAARTTITASLSRATKKEDRLKRYNKYVMLVNNYTGDLCDNEKLIEIINFSLTLYDQLVKENEKAYEKNPNHNARPKEFKKVAANLLGITDNLIGRGLKEKPSAQNQAPAVITPSESVKLKKIADVYGKEIPEPLIQETQFKIKFMQAIQNSSEYKNANKERRFVLIALSEEIVGKVRFDESSNQKLIPEAMARVLAWEKYEAELAEIPIRDKNAIAPSTEQFTLEYKNNYVSSDPVGAFARSEPLENIVATANESVENFRKLYGVAQHNVNYHLDQKNNPTVDDMQKGPENSQVQPLPKNPSPGEIIADNIAKIKCLQSGYKSRTGDINREYHGKYLFGNYSVASFLTTNVAVFFRCAYSATEKLEAASKVLETLATISKRVDAVLDPSSLPKAARQGELGKCMDAIIEAQKERKELTRKNNVWCVGL